jgi:1-acyl-sn-glycerol-3-phosphate acyltransferase
VPVAIDGSYDVFEKHHRVTKVPVKVSFCNPIYTADMPSADRKLILSDKIYTVIKEQLK